MTDTIILGAGMVGVSTALALQAQGHVVTVVDRLGPGQETSYGNAGIIQAEAVEPYPLPLDLPTLVDIALARTNNVAWSLGGMRHWLGPVLRYAQHSRPGGYRSKIVPAWARMIHRATADHGALITAAGADDLISRDGYRKVYRSERGFAAAAAAAERYRSEHGVPHQLLDGAEIAAVEPGLRHPLAGAVHWTSSWSCKDPGALVGRYAALFERQGGRILRGDAMSLQHNGPGWQIATDAGPVNAERAVVCLGPWSPTLLSRFGHRVPMVFKRGYHLHFRVEQGPRLPMMDVETGTFLSPMTKGLRILTGAELNGLGAAPRLRQLQHSTKSAQQLFKLGAPVEDQPWMGTRPCLPGMLPMIGRSPRQPGLWYNFGHGHQGFTLGPTTARVLSEAMSAS
ncbi:D-amino-acid dehydrogenase [Devosia subaequoris]|uniref:D-amino-acid dehydrogenase n=1 Tax=Devosia subaequoris TaxID=395930 RepID=A0A7W6ILN2_9HYPH|nr:FAD-dependent oxidoreductase [Devosia subaequoris]MBB4051903.1 D-amino-acid dehydrogenase [Devosia subaequoris]MCP1210070.1 FAD-binding oxidoreductase [Devosia subaequoris]